MNYFNYFTEIEETFIRRRGKHLLLSSLDWALIESWQEREIPLKIVLRGIENVFDAIDKNPNRVRTIKSLSYCREEIEAQYVEWSETQIGKTVTEETGQDEVNEVTLNDENTLFSDETIEKHLESLRALLLEAKAKADKPLREVLDKILIEISEQTKSKIEAEQMEKFLNGLEGEVDEVLLEICETTSLEKLRKQIENELSIHRGTMENEVYQRTFDLMLLKKLRENAEIPPFSLFYL